MGRLWLHRRGSGAGTLQIKAGRFASVACVATLLLACRPQRGEHNPPPAAEATAPPSGPRALRDVVFERTSARVERGRYLAEGLLQCFRCHSERDWTAPGAPPLQDKKGAGVVWWDKAWLVAPNLTPDAETGSGRRTDDMLARAIREGIGHDGRVLHPQMWYSSFRRLSDEDVASVVVYLRSLPPIRNELPKTNLPPDVAKELKPPEPLNSEVAPPDPSDPVQRGRHLVLLADCMGCHTSWYTPRNPGLFAGGNLIEEPDGSAYSTNITSDPSGIPYYDAALFREVMRTGRVKARELNPAMPWIVFRNLSDDDLDAIYAYLRALRPARHAVGNLDPPTVCPLCGGTHPLGDRNRPPELRPLPYSPADVRDFVGHYRFDDGFLLVFELLNGRFVIREGEGASPKELLTEDGRAFRTREGGDVIEFVRDGQGRVTHLVEIGTETAVKTR